MKLSLISVFGKPARNVEHRRRPLLSADAEVDGDIETDFDTEDSETQEDYNKFEQYSKMGLFLSVLCGVPQSIGGLLVKLAVSMSPCQLVMYRPLGMLVCSLISASWDPGSWCGVGLRQWGLVWLRAAVGTVGQFGYIFAIRYVSLSDAAAIVQSYPAFTIVLNWIFLKKTFRVYHALAIAATVSGAILVAHPVSIFGQTDSGYHDSHQLLGTLLALVTALSASAVAIILHLISNVPSSLIFFCYSLLTVLSAFLVNLQLGQLGLPADLKEYGIVVGLMACTWGYQFTMTYARRHAAVSLMAALRTLSSISFTMLLQYLVLSQVPAVTSLAGTALIVASIVLLSQIEE